MSDGLEEGGGERAALAGDGQNGRRVFCFVEEDGRLGRRRQFDLGGAGRPLSRGGLTFLAATATAVREHLTQSLKHHNSG